MSGRMFEVTPIRVDLAIILQHALIKKIQSKYPDIECVKLGSVGHKPSDYLHNDIDIGVKCESIEQLNSIISNVFSESARKISESYYLVSIAYEYDTDKFIQIDFILVHDIEFTKFRYKVPNYIKGESNYKTGMKIMFVSMLLNHTDEVQYDVKEGYFGKFDWTPVGLYRYEINKNNFMDYDYYFVTTDVNSIIYTLFNENGKYEDFNSVESLWKAIHSEKFKYPEKLKLIELRWFINCYRKGWYSIKPEDFDLKYWTAEDINKELEKFKLQHVINKFIQNSKEI